MGKPRVVVTQLAMAGYRQGFLEEVERLVCGAHDLTFLVGPQHLDVDLTTNVQSHLVRPVENRFFLNRRLAWQRRVLSSTVKCDVAILELNPRVLTSWVIVVLRRILGRPTMFWGHVHPRAGREGRSAVLRAAYRSLASGLICYTDEEATDARARHPGQRIYVAPNAVTTHLPSLNRLPFEQRRDFLYVGRLTAAKRVAMVLDAFKLVLREQPDARLVIVGEGSERHPLELLAASLPKASVQFVGHVSAPETLAFYYATAAAAVAPGWAGLNVIQAAQFEVPVVLSRVAKHAPEVGALENGAAIWADADLPGSWATAMLSVFDSGHRQSVNFDAIKSRHNFPAMAKGFVDAARLTEPPAF